MKKESIKIEWRVDWPELAPQWAKDQYDYVFGECQAAKRRKLKESGWDLFSKDGGMNLDIPDLDVTPEGFSMQNKGLNLHFFSPKKKLYVKIMDRKHGFKVTYKLVDLI